MPRVYIAGLIEGVNYPSQSDGQRTFFIDVDRCKDLIIVDRRYFLDNCSLIYSWADSVEQTQARQVSTAL